MRITSETKDKVDNVHWVKVESCGETADYDGLGVLLIFRLPSIRCAARFHQA